MNSLDQDLARAIVELRLAAARERQLVRLAKQSQSTIQEQRRHRVTTSLHRLLSGVQRLSSALADAGRTRSRSRLQVVSPAGPDSSTDELAVLLDRAAYSLVEKGTTTERPLLEILSAATAQRSPGAAAALVDWSGSEVARLRAYGIVHGLVLDLAPHEQRLVLARIRGGSTLPLAG